MYKTTSIKVQTPQGIGSGLFRDMLALELGQWAKNVTIKNVHRSEILCISKIPIEEVESVISKIRFMGAEIIEN